MDHLGRARSPALRRPWGSRARLALILFASSVGGCEPPSAAGFPATAPLMPVSEDAASATAGPPRRQTSIIYEQLDGRPFPHPLVRASVRGVDTLLILDTGASHTVLDTWLVEQLGVELSRSDQGAEGHAGERVATMVAHAPHLEVQGWGRVPGDRALAVALPRVFRNLGLGGVLSPQSLAVSGLVVEVDFRTSTVREVRPADVDPGGAGLGVGHPCRVGGDQPGVVYLVDGAIEDRAARWLVDSGVARSDVLANSPVGRRLVGQAGSGEVSYTAGGRVAAAQLAGAAIAVGSVRKTLDVVVLPGAPSAACPRDGHLGLDVLRDCILWLQPDHFAARCGPRTRH